MKASRNPHKRRRRGKSNASNKEASKRQKRQIETTDGVQYLIPNVIPSGSQFIALHSAFLCHFLCFAVLLLELPTNHAVFMTPLSPSSWDHYRHCSQVRASFHSAVSSHLACLGAAIPLLHYTIHGDKGRPHGDAQRKGPAQWRPTFSAPCYGAVGVGPLPRNGPKFSDLFFFCSLLIFAFKAGTLPSRHMGWPPWGRVAGSSQPPALEEGEWWCRDVEGDTEARPTCRGLLVMGSDKGHVLIFDPSHAGFFFAACG